MSSAPVAMSYTPVGSELLPDPITMRVPEAATPTPVRPAPGTLTAGAGFGGLVTVTVTVAVAVPPRPSEAV